MPRAHHLVRWIGHSTVVVELAGTRLVTDPNLSARTGLIVRRRGPRPPAAADLGALDAILVSHGHLDHCDLPTLRALARAAAASDRSPPVVVTARGTGDLVRGAGFADVRPLAWGEATTLPGGAVVEAIPAAHLPGRSPLHRGTGYQGYVVHHGGGCVMFAGDTGPCAAYARVGGRFAIDVALLPIGAYSPPPLRHWHMAPEDALDALEQLRARLMVPIHHSTFRLSAEPLAAPARRLATHARRRGLAARVRMLAPGEALEFGA